VPLQCQASTVYQLSRTERESTSFEPDLGLHVIDTSALPWRFAARVSGLASGLALAVRPAGPVEVSRVNGAPQARLRAARMRSTGEAHGNQFAANSGTGWGTATGLCPVTVRAV